jgi:hypothetical protein
VAKDRETSERAGMEGVFQIERMWRVDSRGGETDVTDEVDQGLHFSDEDTSEFKSYLSRVFDIPVKGLDVDEV